VQPLNKPAGAVVIFEKFKKLKSTIDEQFWNINEQLVTLLLFKFGIDVNLAQLRYIELVLLTLDVFKFGILVNEAQLANILVVTVQFDELYSGIVSKL
jgi:hypothetical protein